MRRRYGFANDGKDARSIARADAVGRRSDGGADMVQHGHGAGFVVQPVGSHQEGATAARPFPRSSLRQELRRPLLRELPSAVKPGAGAKGDARSLRRRKGADDLLGAENLMTIRNLTVPSPTTADPELSEQARPSRRSFSALRKASCPGPQ
jgi:hypothetical protein